MMFRQHGVTQIQLFVLVIFSPEEILGGNVMNGQAYVYF